MGGTSVCLGGGCLFRGCWCVNLGGLDGKTLASRCFAFCCGFMLSWAELSKRTFEATIRRVNMGFTSV